MKKIEVIIHHEIPIPPDKFLVVSDYLKSFLACVNDSDKYHVGDRVKVVPAFLPDNKEAIKLCIYMKIDSLIRGERYGLKKGDLFIGLTKINL